MSFFLSIFFTKILFLHRTFLRFINIYKLSLEKDWGSSSSNVYISYSVFEPASIILNCFASQNSDITCRQTPHGARNSLLSPTIAIAANSLFPSETALKNAVRSAQFVGEYAAFSILHPVYILSSFVRTAAPTI